VKTVAATLQVARSNIIERRDGSRPQCGPQNRAGDVDLVADIRRLVDQRPTYGYRRIAALLKRERRSAGRHPVNAKRIFRLMKKHGLLLQRYTGRRRPGEHDGKIITIRYSSLGDEVPSDLVCSCDQASMALEVKSVP
jgi:transposase InsO family protein